MWRLLCFVRGLLQTRAHGRFNVAGRVCRRFGAQASRLAFWPLLSVLPTFCFHVALFIVSFLRPQRRVLHRYVHRLGVASGL